MAEFLEAFAICAFTATFFLGGWHGPALPVWPLFLVTALVIATAREIARPLQALFAIVSVGAAVTCIREPIPSWLWFFAKTYTLVFVLVWFRGTFPRLRVDQLMGLAWKFFLPLSLVNIIAAAIWWSWRDSAAGWLFSFLVLAASWWALVRANKPAPLQRRAYVFAD
jgi:NADH:ubiquinone oxidoreductase subunit H